MSLFIKELVNDIITGAVDSIIHSKFYLIKYSPNKKKFISNEIEYKNVISDFDTSIHTVSDIVKNLIINLTTILPVPIINGEYFNKDIPVSKLPSKLIIVFVNMNILRINRYPLPETIMNYINNSNDSIINMFNLSDTSPPVYNSSNVTMINTSNNQEKYKDEIKVLKDMGFTDENKIIESLIVSEGDINNAIHYYLQ
tara:strand:- start:183 stop:776 length:594 start_codon:yes stop_codon:yes gene_type:complete